MHSDESQWVQFFHRCQSSRLDVDTFSSYAKLLSSRISLPPNRIADVFLRPTEHNSISPDPRVTLYIQALQELNLINVPAVLRALLKYSTFQPPRHSDGANEGGMRLMKWENSYVSEEVILYSVARSVSSGATPKDAHEAVEIFKYLAGWMSVLLAVNAADDILQVMGSVGTQTVENLAVKTALGTVLVALADNPIATSALQKSCPKDVLKSFTHALSSFTPSLIQNSSANAERLELFRNQVLLPLQPVDPKEQAANAEIDQIIDSSMGLGIDNLGIMDLPIINYRAGLYIYLNSLLVGKPNIDDSVLYNFLQNRYQGDVQTSVIELVLASFDVLSNATFRNETPQTQILLRSYLINKVPVLLTNLVASAFPPLSSEFCITEALSHVDTNAFPTFSSMFDESSNGGNIFSDSVRQDFCFACCLHGLIPEDSIERLLGETPMQTLPDAGRYVKEDLVRQCLTDPERSETLIEELERTDGNVGAASQALVEVMRHLAISQDTLSLKTLCTHLVRKPSTLDVILLFNKSTTLLQPICNLLDNWRYDEDQGEYQPIYEQFGAILLLVLAFVHRYNLNMVDLGLTSSESFVARLLERGSTSRSLEELTDTEKNHLDGWIRGLFDGEGGGLGDELMSSCPPQDFYLLVPTLFLQIVIARSTNYLSEESLKGGLEYLVDTFLLPSLVGAITWLSRHLWYNHSIATTLLQILTTLIKPISISNEASLMHSTILNIIAKPLEHSLRSLQRHEPSRQDIEPLSSALKPHLIYSRTSGSDHTELENWASTQGMGLISAIRTTITHLVDWCINMGGNITPASYTHRQILVTTKLIGAKRLILALIEEVMKQTSGGNGSAVMDVVASLICAQDLSEKSNGSMQPQLMNMLDHSGVNMNGSTNLELQTKLTLKDELNFLLRDAAKIHKIDVDKAGAIVRLYRRVEVLSALPPQTAGISGLHDGLVPGSAGLHLGDGGMGIGGGMGGEGLLDEGLMGLGDGDELLGGMKLDIGSGDFNVG